MERIRHLNFQVPNIVTSIHTGLAFLKDVSSRPKRAAKQEIDFKEILGGISEHIMNSEGRLVDIDIKIHVRKEAPFVSNKQQMEMVLLQLISNSVKNVSPEIYRPFVYIRIWSHVAGTSISIRHNCRAVKKEILESTSGLFAVESEPIEQSPPEWYMVAKAIKKLQGRIAVAPEQEDGTELNIYLPNYCN